MFKWLFGGKSDGGEQSSGGDSEVVVVTRKLPHHARSGVCRLRRSTSTTGGRASSRGAAPTSPRSRIEPKLNGAAYEVDTSGKRAVWGTVLSVQRPSHIVIAWQIRPDRTPGGQRAASSRVDVRFDAGRRRRHQRHHRPSRFSRHGDDWKKYHAAMGGKSGWPRLMQLYAEAAAKA